MRTISSSGSYLLNIVTKKRTQTEPFISDGFGIKLEVDKSATVHVAPIFPPTDPVDSPSYCKGKSSAIPIVPERPPDSVPDPEPCSEQETQSNEEWKDALAFNDKEVLNIGCASTPGMGKIRASLEQHFDSHEAFIFLFGSRARGHYKPNSN